MEYPPAQIAAWLACAAFVLWILNNGRKFMDGFRERPVPAETYATKDEVDALRTDLNSLRTEAKATRETILQEGRARAAGVYSRIEDVRREVKQDTEITHKRIDALAHEVGNKIQALPNEMVALLRNTGVIK